jgi:transcriptional regulator with XRE-family HTH domain
MTAMTAELGSARLRQDVGLRLRLHRRRAGFSQTQVAAATGWSPSAVSMYELGRREAGYERLVCLAALYGVSIAEFFPAVGLSDFP